MAATSLLVNQPGWIVHNVPYLPAVSGMNDLDAWSLAFKMLGGRGDAMTTFEALCSRIKKLQQVTPLIQSVFFEVNHEVAAKVFPFKHGGNKDIMAAVTELMTALEVSEPVVFENEFGQQRTLPKLNELEMSALQDFSAQEVEDFGTFLKTTIDGSRLPIFTSFLQGRFDAKAFFEKTDAEIRWDSLPEHFQGVFCYKFAIMAAALDLGFQATDWSPEKGFDALKRSLKQKPLLMSGFFGEKFYLQSPPTTLENSGSSHKFFVSHWDREAEKTHGEGFEQVITVIGVRDTPRPETVYFHVPGIEKIQSISYKNFVSALQTIAWRDTHTRQYQMVYAYQKY